MTDPKTAARTVATRLAESEISIKHLQALDLVAAGCGFQDRSKLKDLAELPVLKRVNAHLLDSVATVLARHDLIRRARIVEITTDVLVPARILDMRDVRSRGDAIGGGFSKGVIPFMKVQLDAISSVSQGATYREGYAHFAPIDSAEVLKFVSERSGVSVWHDQVGVEGAYVIAATSDDQPNDAWTVFWNENDGWVAFDSATLYPDRSGDLPTAGMPANSAVRWMDIDDAAFRAAVDAATLEMDQDEPEIGFDPEMPGERMLDYDRIAAMIALSKVFERPMGPLEIAVRDGAQRASLYTASLSDDPNSPGGQVVGWVRDVTEAFRNGLAPGEMGLRALLMEGDAAISGIRTWLSVEDRLWAWIIVAAYPDAISNEIDADGSGVTEGIDMEPIERIVAGMKRKSAPKANDKTALDERRQLAAQVRFEAHAFGRHLVVAEADGWERTTPGDEWSRTIYLESAEAEVDDVTESATYVVRFAPDLDKVVSSYAISGSGTMIGTTLDPDHAGTLDIGEGLAIPIAAVVGEISLENCAEAKAIIDEVVKDVYFSTWSPLEEISKSSATEIASLAIAGLREAKTADEREDARRSAVASVLPPQNASDACWSEVRTNAQTIIDAIDGAMDELDGRIDYDRDELEQEIMNLAFARLEEEDDSTWRNTFQGSNTVELYLHMLPKGDSVEESCTIDHPHLRPENVVVDDQFRFVLSRLGITPTEWKAFAKPKTIEKVVTRAPARRGEPLVSPKELGVLIENGATQNFLVSLYCQAPLMDVLDLDMTKPIAFERCSVCVVNVMVGTFMDKRMKDVIEFTDGFDGLLTTSDCGPYASQTEDLVSSAYLSRIGTADTVARGPAATAELDACLAVEGLRRTAPGERVAWRDDGQGGTRDSIVLKADVSCQDASHTYGLRTIVAVFDDAKSTRPEIGIGRRW